MTPAQRGWLLVAAIAVAVVTGSLLRTPPAPGAAEAVAIDESELRALLTDRLTISSGFIAVKNPLSVYAVHTLGQDAPWSVRCGDVLGLSVVFFPDAKDESAGVIVQIAPAQPSADECVALSLRTARTLRDMLRNPG